MKRKSIKTAIILPLLITLLIGIAVMAAAAGILSSNTAAELTDDLISADIDLARNEFLAITLEIESSARVLAPVIAAAVDSEFRQLDPRGFVIQLLSDTLRSDDKIIAIWTCWEPNAFDGRDSAYKWAPYHDETGRFIPIVFRGGGGITVQALSDYEEPLAGEDHHCAKTIGKPHITNPYRYSYGGTNELVLTYSFPIVVDGKTAGAVGVDFLLTDIIKSMNNIRILDDGYIFVLSHGGNFVSNPNQNLITQRYNTMWLRDVGPQIERLFASGGTFSSKSFSDTMNDTVLVHGASVQIASENWVVGAVVPQKTVQASSTFLLWTIIVIGVALLIAIGLIVYFIVHYELKHLPKITDAAEAMSLGNIDIEGLDSGTTPTHNEVIKLERAFSHMLESYKKQAYILARVAEGDYTSKVDIRSDKDVINMSIDLMLEETLEVLHSVASAGILVADGSKNIADGAQTLAKGSTEQAAAVEELSSSMSEIAYKTKENADKAGKAAALADNIKRSAEKGSHQMDDMMLAVKEINQASHSINKVIKVIDDIAFQTNILALNAAVEAARAGQHGKGFAVVAEEVRSLAAKSAEAARDTGVLISNSIERADLGSRIAAETAASLNEIVSGINESTQIVNDISMSSVEQYQAIKQINEGVLLVAEVVQQNAATAEESAAASQEMNSQSAILHDLIAQFQLRDEGKTRGHFPPPHSR